MNRRSGRQEHVAIVITSDGRRVPVRLDDLREERSWKERIQDAVAALREMLGSPRG